ncbi:MULTISPECIES: DUF3306 domain-containing protein [Halomonadaceae]|uniref:DUF3306 domain-containing protein n=1 Tax=Halomonadaceae TaxID=28256 RepID=UPI000C32EDFB|nr:DUF3306 domain-containing protein [Halomonas sp. MES3-P3E]PKG46916.1 DUF3306 domain-containing protein [Halomonas sp. MES3-P3E]
MSRLERWSRLKRHVQKEEDASASSSLDTKPLDEASADQEAVLHNEAEQPNTENEQPLVTPAEEPDPGSLDHTLPDPDTLEAGSDFSAYMAPGVSGPLRRQALKRLWATGNYNVRDGLDDYDADYNKLLKPMAADLAGKLRRWTHKVEEALDKPVDEGSTESPAEVAASEPSTAADEEHTAPCTASNNVVKETSLDDQSDYLSDTHTKL